MGFPKNHHFGVFWGYHHLRKHPCTRFQSLEAQVDRWPGAIVMAKQTIYSMLLLHVSLAFATKAKEVFSAEDPQAALRKLKSESLPQAWVFCVILLRLEFSTRQKQIRGRV